MDLPGDRRRMGRDRRGGPPQGGAGRGARRARKYCAVAATIGPVVALTHSVRIEPGDAAGERLGVPMDAAALRARWPGAAARRRRHGDGADRRRRAGGHLHGGAQRAGAGTRVAGIHAAFVGAGARLVLDEHVRGEPVPAGAARPRRRVGALCAPGVALAREAGAELVGGSMGPLGVRLQPYGRVAGRGGVRRLREQAAALAEAGVDLLVIETQTDLRELEQAVAAARDAAPGLAVRRERDVHPRRPDAARRHARVGGAPARSSSASTRSG